MKIKPRISKGSPPRSRKRDGVLSGEYPDNGWFWAGVTPKVVCLGCKKVWRGAVGRRSDLRASRQTPRTCPHCGLETFPINPMARLPRKRNAKAWRRIGQVIAK